MTESVTLPAPLVLADDDGVRHTSGLLGCCIYCKRKIGEPHDLAECVVIVRDVTYAVWLHAASDYDCEKGRRIGTWVTTEPWHWTEEDGRFHKNDGSWCTDNMRDSGS